MKSEGSWRCFFFLSSAILSFAGSIFACCQNSPYQNICSLTVMLTLFSLKERKGELTCVQHTTEALTNACKKQTKERNPFTKVMALPCDIIVATTGSFKITRGSSSPQRVHVLWLRSYWASRNGEFPGISDAQLSTHFHPYCIKVYIS